ncbi:phage major capsid protein [Lacticaseibacillus paracasei subsp. paracasei Lpp228]|uniref:phage major capsid protein n=1 Tax=Lacticaseibacillus paracasei TaxID=1597 RepID=UPI000343522D|nr:phage major capsid protein [Lacticaseibacillus paracasei]EPC60650.1 phage major capsid protein [Lacticaseibacillus paracasei subsp. paracasei Lpp189]EPC68878.1 phage major capsid protein [Lacticaseibacillus paracasei subsp. paracasei Lpp228]
MNQDDVEKRLNPNAGLTAKADDSQGQDDPDTKKQDDTTNGPKKLSGYAVVFNSPSKDLGGFKEVVDPHAFDHVDLSDVYMVSNHDFSQVLASTKAGTLTLNVDDKGLQFEATLPDTTTANDAYSNVQAGNLSAMSFTFNAAPDGDTFTKDDSGQVIRTIKQVKSLFDVSLVAIPAYDNTNVQVDKRSYTEWLKDHVEDPEQQLPPTEKRKGVNHMTEKTIIDKEEHTESRAYEDYIRSMGEQRDGLTTTTAGAVVPKEVINDVFDLKESDYDLAKYVTVKQVGTPVGTYPIALTNNGVLATKAELADIPEIDSNLFRGVDYKVATRAGKIYLSNELVEDSEVDIVAEVKNQLKKLVQNTDNSNIISVLTGKSTTGDNFKHLTGTGLDDLKKTFNIELDPALSLSVIVNQDAFNYLDTLKDSQGRYLLQPSITAPSGKQLFGAPVIVVANKVLPTDKVGTYRIIIGDFSQAIFLAQKNEVNTQWERFDSYSQGLAVVIRNDYEVVDPDAARIVDITPVKA